MRKKIVQVPKGVEFLSDWAGFDLPEESSIINKTLTGCGFTQWCLTSLKHLILCSPRRVLLENKEGWFKDLDEKEEQNFSVFYAKNDYETLPNYDKDLMADPSKDQGENDPPIQQSKEFVMKYKDRVKDFYNGCLVSSKWCKILVTYDSFRKVKEALKELGVLENFVVVIDEMQSIFTDATFKSSTELEFVSNLQEGVRTYYVSATPMIESYLDMTEEFRNLPYYELDWETLDPGRVIKPKVIDQPCSRLTRKAKEIIEKYKTGNWKPWDNNTKSYIDKNGDIVTVSSREAVFYMNSVKNICDIIRSCKLTQDECNILCANTERNSKMVMKAFGIKKASLFKGLGHVPLKSEMNKNKMFTFCTRTVYLGADFWSTNARSFIFSDSNIYCMTVDITLDLPQIIGRQRCDENPWKNEAVIYYNSTRAEHKETLEEFKARVSEKVRKTKDYLDIYNNRTLSKSQKCSLTDMYEDEAKNNNYRKNYIAVNTHGGSNKYPVMNNLVMISEMRAYQVSQIEYSDRFSVRNTIVNSNMESQEDKEIRQFVEYFDSIPGGFKNKMKFLCENLRGKDNVFVALILDSIDNYYSNYYVTLGPDKLRALNYCVTSAEKELKSSGVDIKTIICNAFSVGDRISNAEIKNRFKEIYNENDYYKTPKATDINNYFNTRKIKITVNGKKINGLELLRRRIG